MPTNDNAPIAQEPMHATADPHGHAALILVESLIHGLCEASTLSTGDAIEIVERAVDVQHDSAVAADEAGARMWRAHDLLSSIAASLKIDADRAPRPPQLTT